MIRKCVILVVLLSLNAAASSQDITLKATEVEGGLTMLEGEGGFAGGNMAVLTGEDGHHPGVRRRRRGVDRLDAGMGVRTANDDRVGHPRPGQIIGVLALAGDEIRIFAALDRAAENRHQAPPFAALATALTML